MMSTHPLIFQTLRQSLTGKTAAGKAHFNQVLHEKLLHSDLLSAYQHAFRTATGLPLHFMKPDIGANSICELGEKQQQQVLRKAEPPQPRMPKLH